MLKALAFIVVVAVGLPLVPYAVATKHSPISVPSPGADLWRAVRGAEAGDSQVKGVESAVLINSAGEQWRQFRTDRRLRYGGLALIAIVGLLALFYAVRGSIKLEQGNSGQRVARWSRFERTMHWYTATLFVIMAITGLSLSFGRLVLIPLLGPEGFGAYAQLARIAHNYLGPLFFIGVLLIILTWMRYSFPAKGDLKWFLQGGGVIRNSHPSAGRFNAGEKLWFWIICTVGVAVCITGLILDFPNYEQTRETMQQSNVIHTIASLIWIGVFLGHAYLGTLGTAGALEGMTGGQVDVNWAKQHHDRWYEEVQNCTGDEDGQFEVSKDTSR